MKSIGRRKVNVKEQNYRAPEQSISVIKGSTNMIFNSHDISR